MFCLERNNDNRNRVIVIFFFGLNDSRLGNVLIAFVEFKREFP